MSGRMQALYRQNLIVMITSAKLLHLWPPELGRSLFTLWNYRGVGKNAPNRRWKNGPQFCVGFFGFAGNAACSLRAISVCVDGRWVLRPSNRYTDPADWRGDFNHGNGENGGRPQKNEKMARNEGGGFEVTFLTPAAPR